jgi:hypothetical protein
MRSTAVEERVIYHNGRTWEEHDAWLESLEGDEYRIVYMPVGHLFSLANVAFFKYALLNVRMTAGEQLKFLNGIASAVHGPVTAEAVEAIEPACNTALQMLIELNKIPRGERVSAFQEGDVFRILARLNPSLLRALELCQWHPPVPQKRTA